VTFFSFYFFVFKSKFNNKSEENKSSLNLVIFGKIFNYSPFFKITLLIIGLSFSFILQHEIFDTMFPVERTAILLIPLLCLQFFLFMQEILNSSNKKRTIIFSFIFFLIFAIPFGYTFVKKASCQYVYDWIYDCNTKDVISIIENEHRINNQKNISLTTNWLFEPQLIYYKKVNNLNYLRIFLKPESGYNSEYAYCLKIENDEIIKTEQYNAIACFEVSGSSLFKKNPETETKLNK